MNDDIELKIRTRIQFGRKIIEENNSRKKINKEIARLKAQYGEDFFLPFDLDAIKQKEYSKEYFKNLVSYFHAGACSEAFFLHIFEVKRKLRIRKIIKIFIPILIIFCLLFVFIIFHFYRSFEKTKYKTTISAENFIIEDFTNNQNEKDIIQEPEIGIEEHDEIELDMAIDDANKSSEIQPEQNNVKE